MPCSYEYVTDKFAYGNYYNVLDPKANFSLPYETNLYDWSYLGSSAIYGDSVQPQNHF